MTRSNTPATVTQICYESVPLAQYVEGDQRKGHYAADVALVTRDVWHRFLRAEQEAAEARAALSEFFKNDFQRKLEAESARGQ